MKTDRDWTDQLPELFDGYAESEPEGLWDAVSSAVAPAKRRAALWWYAGGLLSAAAIAAVVLLLRPYAPSAPLDGSGISIVRGETVLAEVQPAAVPQANTELLPVHHTVIPVKSIRENSVPTQEQQAFVQEMPEEDKQKGEQTGSEKAENKVEDVAERAHESPVYISSVSKTKIKVEAVVSGTGLTGRSYSYASSTGGVVAASSVATKSMSGAGGSFDFGIVSRNKPSTTETSHSASARIGFGLKVMHTGSRWGLESGIVFSTLNTLARTTAGNSIRDVHRQSEYLGIPLYLNYNAAEWRRFSIYLSAGPMYEFATGTHLEETAYMNGNRVSSSTDDTLVKDRIWSLNAGAGLQYGFTGHSSLFVQPGFSYHFSGNSSVESYYTAHPAAFNITLGYRLTLF